MYLATRLVVLILSPYSISCSTLELEENPSLQKDENWRSRFSSLVANTFKRRNLVDTDLIEPAPADKLTEQSSNRLELDPQTIDIAQAISSQDYTTDMVIAAAQKCLQEMNTIFECMPLFRRLISEYDGLDRRGRKVCETFFDSTLLTKLYVYMFGPPHANLLLDRNIVSTMLQNMKPGASKRLMYTDLIGVHADRIASDPGLRVAFTRGSNEALPVLLSAKLDLRGSPRNWSQTGPFFKNLKLLWELNKTLLLSYVPKKGTQDRNYDFVRYLPYWKQLEAGRIHYDNGATFSEEFLLSLDLYLFLRKNSLGGPMSNMSNENLLNENIFALIYNYIICQASVEEQKHLAIEDIHVKIIDVLSVLGTLNLAQEYFHWAGKNNLPFDKKIVAAAADNNLKHSQKLRLLNSTSILPIRRRLSFENSDYFSGGEVSSCVECPEKPCLKWDPSAMAFFIRAAGEIPTEEECPEMYAAASKPQLEILEMIRPLLEELPLNPCLESLDSKIPLNWRASHVHFLEDAPWKLDRFEHEYTIGRIYLHFKFSIPLTEPLMYRAPSASLQTLPVEKLLKITLDDTLVQYCKRKSYRRNGDNYLSYDFSVETGPKKAY